MGHTLTVKDDRLIWRQAAWDRNRRIIAERDVPLNEDQIRQQADNYVDFLREVGADLRGSVLSEIEANQLRINSLVEEVRRSRSAEEVEALGQRLNGVVELTNRLLTVLRTVGVRVEGTVGILQTAGSRGENETTYDVTFAQNGGGQALRTRFFNGRRAVIEFLRNDLRIDECRIDAACSDLEQANHATIPNVRLTYYDLMRLKLD